MNWNNDNNNDKDNEKKILCFKMLNNKKCNYGNKCMYAHGLNEQKMEPLRHKAYTIIKFAKDLSNIDFIIDPALYDSLLQLTKVCSLCNKGQCPGGYNCRNGAVNIKYRVCYDDLVYGNCKRPNCQAIHLTERDLIPYIKQKNKHNFPNIRNSTIRENKDYKDYKDNKDNDSPDNIQTYYEKTCKNNKLKKELDDVQGILLTENFLLTQFGKTLDPDEELSEDEKCIDELIKYLNNNDTESDEESIFLI